MIFIFPPLRLNAITKSLLILLLFAFVAAYGQMQERVAILNTLDDSDSISISESAYLTDRLREIATDVLPKSLYGIMTTESIVAFLGSYERMVKECKESSCLAELGRKVSADYVAQGRIRKFGELFSINFELYNTKSGVLVGSFNGNSKDVYGFVAIIDEKAPALFRKLESKDTTTVSVTAVSQAPIVTNIVYDEAKPAKSSHTMVAVALDIAGVVLVSAGLLANANMQNALDRYGKRGQPQSHYNDAWQDVKSSRSARNIRYIAGGVALVSGIGVHIWF